MRVGVIGIMGSGGTGSYAMRIGSVLNKQHTAYCFPTQNYEPFDADGMIRTYPISIILDNHVDEIEYIIVVQSQIWLHNDTDIPLLLFKTESVIPDCTVDNPTIVIKKLEKLDDYKKYEHTIGSAIASYRYDCTQEKDIMILDVPWLPLPFEEYIARVAKAQHLIVMQRYHDIDTYTCRVIEAMACKTIPIIFYNDPDTKSMYESIGIDEDVAYFVSVRKYGDLRIKEYDIEMAERGYKLVIDKFNMNYHADKFMELLLNA